MDKSPEVPFEEVTIQSFGINAYCCCSLAAILLMRRAKRAVGHQDVLCEGVIVTRHSQEVIMITASVLPQQRYHSVSY